jgi:FMN phosphatase YigB (HAD superfamily)
LDLDGTVFENRLRRFMVPGLEEAVLYRRRRRPRLRPPSGRWHRLRSTLGRPWLGVIRRVALRTLPRRTVLYADVPPVLTALRDLGFRIGAVTNGYHVYQEPLLEGLGILALFDRLVTPERTGVVKPHPRMWTEGFGGEPVVLHVGDRLYDDVVGAHAAGIFAVWLVRRPRKGNARLRRLLEVARPDATVGSLWEVLDLVTQGTPGRVRLPQG